jgi:hypothetical protein
MALAVSFGAHAARNSLERLIRDVVLRGERESLIAAISANYLPNALYGRSGNLSLAHLAAAHWPWVGRGKASNSIQ